MWYIAAGILVVSLLIIIHESGHFFFAKIFKMPVETFCLGYGKPVLKKKWRGTVYGIGPFPFGGYVKIPGLDPREKELIPEEDRKTFILQPYWKRVLVVTGGPIANILSAVLIYTAVFIIGVPGVTMTVERVLPDSPAAQAGLKAGDRIVKVDGKSVSKWEEVVAKIRDAGAEDLTLTVSRGDGYQDVNTEIGVKDGVKYIGIVAKQADYNVGLGFLDSLKSSVIWIGVLIYEIFRSLILLITGRLPFRPLSPVGIVQVTSQAARHGLVILLNFVGFLSVAIGAMNLIPIFPLDGARVVLWTVERVKRKPLSDRAVYVFQFAGIGLLLFIMVWAVYLDVFKAIPDPFR
jgi:regulator of sigma E protease